MTPAYGIYLNSELYGVELTEALAAEIAARLAKADKRVYSVEPLIVCREADILAAIGEAQARVPGWPRAKS